MNGNLQVTIKSVFKALFIIGCGFAFIGIFFDFYSLHGTHPTEGLVVHWNYNLFTEWTTPITDTTGFNSHYYPGTFDISLILHVLFLGTVIISLFCIILKGLNYSKDLSKRTIYAYIHFFLLLLIGFYVFIFPLFFLVPRGIPFPLALINDNETGITLFYTIGAGYILELFAFVCVFAYVIFYIQTIRNYEIDETDISETIITEKVSQSLKPIDLEQQIAQERISLELESTIKSEE
jgi:heme/copper-type cytochrome/quinol oxidase subunit 1